MMPVPTVTAYQQPASTLEWLTVDLWPDYDRASVLVLLTGSVVADAPLPAQVTLPLPPEATLNAVARISDAGEMIDDIEFESSDGTVTLVTPDRRFRIEYYIPYSSDGLQREFAFNWPGGPAISQLDVSVQQPQAATSITVQPEPETVITGSDGLQYHNLPMRQLQAAESFAVQVSYRLSREQLTAQSVASPLATPAAEPATAPPDTNWTMILALAGAALLLAAIGWQIFGARLTARTAPRKPRPVRAASKGDSVRFCHECGARAQGGDRFCRECGTQLKQG